jgi:4-carboxymuconolactone decarboxylase
VTEPDGEALEIMGRFLGEENVDVSRQYLRSLDPKLEEHIIEFVYGQVYSGTGLDPVTRALITVAMLGVLDQQFQLAVYIRSALRLGATEEQIREVLRQVAVYAGFPVSWNGLDTAKKIFDAGEGDRPAS